MKSFFLFVAALVVFGSCTTSKPFAIHTIGDSTMATKSEGKKPETGWGEILPQLFDSSVVVFNHAVNGRSTKSFISEGRWDKVLAELKKGDLLLIQFGHNDAKVQDSARYSNAGTQYRANLKRFVAEARQKGAVPILLTSIMRRNFNEKGVLVDTHQDYPEVMRAVARETNLPLVDAQLLSEQLLIAYGPEASKQLFLHLAPGEHPNYPDGVADDTHLNETGARKIAFLIANELVKKDKRLFQHRK